MPSESKRQQRFFGAAYGAKKKGACKSLKSAGAKKACKTMSKRQLRDFAQVPDMS